jgi:hypothetical protein
VLILVLGAALLWGSKWKGIRGSDDPTVLPVTTAVNQA